jgi:hypothetical protein
VQLQRSLPSLKAEGLGLVAISYDSPATLKAFADARGITFPLLSDEGSAVIRRYDLLNELADGRSAGIPHPGTFVVDRRGRVVSRSFEAAYPERATVASQLASARTPGVEATTAETEHVRITASASDEVIAPGARLSLFIDIEPKPRMHVYALALRRPTHSVSARTRATPTCMRGLPPTRRRSGRNGRASWSGSSPGARCSSGSRRTRSGSWAGD